MPKPLIGRCSLQFQRGSHGSRSISTRPVILRRSKPVIRLTYGPKNTPRSKSGLIAELVAAHAVEVIGMREVRDQLRAA